MELVIAPINGIKNGSRVTGLKKLYLKGIYIYITPLRTAGDFGLHLVVSFEHFYLPPYIGACRVSTLGRRVEGAFSTKTGNLMESMRRKVAKRKDGQQTSRRWFQIFLVFLFTSIWGNDPI